MSKGSNLFTFISGAAIGVIAGILYAPDKGENTRDRLSYRLGRYKEMLESLLEDIADGKQLNLNAAKSDGEKVISSARLKAEQLLSDVDKLLSQIKPAEQENK